MPTTARRARGRPSPHLQRDLSLLFFPRLNAPLRTEIRKRAAFAPWAAGGADAAPMLDERVADPGPAVPRNDAVEVPLSFHRVRLARPAETAREAPDMRVHDDSVGRSPDVPEDDVRGLASDAGQGVKGLHRSRDLAAVLLDERLRHAAQGLRLRVEKARRTDDVLEGAGRRRRERGGVGEAPEDLGSHLIHARVRALRREDGRDEELERTPEIERARGVRVDR